MGACSCCLSDKAVNVVFPESGNIVGTVTRNCFAMSCENCSMRFGILRRKRTCCSCGFDYCSTCMYKDSLMDKSQSCKRCRVLCAVPLDRKALLALPVRDLRWYLSTKAVSVHGCKEKSELVDLIISHTQRPPPRPVPPRIHVPSHNPLVSPENAETSSVETPNPFVNVSPPQDMPSSSAASSVNQRLSQPYSWTPPERERFPNHDLLRETNRLSEQSRFSSTPDILNDTTVVERSSTPESSDLATIFDIKNPEQIQTLTVRQLKLILARNFIDYKGCCEKRELQDRVYRLWTQKQELKNPDAEVHLDENQCKICMEAPVDCVLLECGHMTCCTLCGKQLSECPICRQFVVRVVHVFKA